MSQRVFIALNLPATVKNELGGVILQLQKQLSGQPIKWVDPPILHLTLHFLGEIDDQTLAEVAKLLTVEIAKYPVLSLALGKLGCFTLPNGSPRVIWVELNEVGGESLRQLQSALKKGLEDLGLETDHRSWQTHITLGRVKDETRFSLPSVKIAPLNFLVETIDLMKSELQPGGPIYTSLEKFNLKKE
ncbi:MAG: RNA 2',3'-cyclic phosphodiesterase [Patescibacteria group bacterium]